MPIYPPNAAHFDANQVPTIMGVVGTLGTADTGGTASPLPFGVDPTTGAAYVNVIQGSISIGTIAEDLTVTSGTITRVSTIGTVEVGTMTNTGTNINVITGTVTSLSNLAAGTLSALASGTITGGTLGNLVSGTINALASGTITGGTLQNLVSGTVNALAAGTITAGTVAVTIGTIVGPTASGGTPTTAPVLIAGTDSTGTVYAPLVTSAGRLRSDGTILGGTIQNLNAGTINALAAGTITAGTLTNLVSGTVNALASGTITGGTLGNLVSGTINALAAGTITAGTVAVSIGTVGGAAANAAAASGNPLPMGGTDSGGTIRTILVDSSGIQRSTGSQVMTSGTLATGTLQNLVSGTVNALASGTLTGGTIQNLVSGTINSGTIVGNGGSIGVQGVGGTGVAAVGNPVLVGGVDSGGTTYRMLVDTAGNPQVDVVTIPQVSVGTLPTLNVATGTVTTGSLTNVAQVHNAGTLAAGANNIGDIDVATGTVTLLSTVTTLSNLTNGSVNVLTGTIQSSGTTTGVGVVSNLTNGSVNVLTGTVTSVANLAAGTTQINSLPVTIGTSYGTLGTTGAAVIGTLVAAAGAGTYQYVSGLSIVVAAGTVDCAITNVGTVAGPNGAGILARGQFTPGGGIVRDFNPVMRSGTNGTIGYWLGGAGTAYFTVNYWNAT